MGLSQRQIEIISKLNRGWKGRREVEYAKLHPRSAATIEHMIARHLIIRMGSLPDDRTLAVTITGQKELEQAAIKFDQVRSRRGW
jgi:hypothetical protein